MKNVQSIYFLLIVATTFLLSSCKKVEFPDGASKELIGSWKYVGDSGGYSGGGGSNKFSADSWIEFTNKGAYIIYKGSKKESKTKFHVEMKSSIHNSELESAIVFSNEYQIYSIENNKLYISDNQYDGYTYHFTKK